MDALTIDLQWKCHQFLFISEVFLLRRVSSSLNNQIQRSLERFVCSSIKWFLTRSWLSVPLVARESTVLLGGVTVPDVRSRVVEPFVEGA